MRHKYAQKIELWIPDRPSVYAAALMHADVSVEHVTSRSTKVKAVNISLYKLFIDQRIASQCFSTSSAVDFSTYHSGEGCLDPLGLVMPQPQAALLKPNADGKPPSRRALRLSRYPHPYTKERSDLLQDNGNTAACLRNGLSTQPRPTLL